MHNNFKELCSNRRFARKQQNESVLVSLSLSKLLNYFKREGSNLFYHLYVLSTGHGILWAEISVRVPAGLLESFQSTSVQ